NCGLANKFEDSDWLPVNVRRGRNILSSLAIELTKQAITPKKVEQSAVRSPQSADEVLTSEGIVKTLQSLYLDHFKPIYLIFDQFEEVFIFGNPEERKEFMTVIKQILNSDVQCKIILVLREEYLASAIEFEREIPTILTNRMRIEKMTWANAKDAIEGPCRVAGIELEEGFAEAALEKLNPESSEVELTYLQVMLDKIYRYALLNIQHPTYNVQQSRRESGEQRAKNKEIGDNVHIQFLKSHLEKIGDVSDLLGSFLEDQIVQLDVPDTGLVILKSFVSIKGTKRQVTLEDVGEFAGSLGKKISEEELLNLVIRFVNLRILREKDESGRYELRHDSLASKIYEKITLVEKEILEVRQFIENAHANYRKRGIPLGSEDLAYIATYEYRLFLKGELDEFVQKCKRIISEKKRSFNRILSISAAGFLLLIAAVVFYYIQSTSSIKSRRLTQEASLQLGFSPGLSFTTALKAYEQDTTSSLAVKALFNAFYALLEENHVTDSFGIVHDPMKEIFDFKPCESDIEFARFSEDGEYIYGYLEDNTVKIWKKNGSEIFSQKLKDTTILAVNFAPDNRHIAAIYEDSLAFIWNRNGALACSVHVYYEPLNPARVISFSPTLEIFSNVANNNCVQIRDYTGDLLYELEGHTAPVNEAVFSPNGELIASASKDSTVIVWGQDSLNRQFNRFWHFSAFQNVVWSVDFSNGSDYVLCASTDTSLWTSVSRLYPFKKTGKYLGDAVYDTVYYELWPQLLVEVMSGLVVSARFTGNDNAVIFTVRNDKKWWLQKQKDPLGDRDYFATLLIAAPESRWQLMSENKYTKNYPWSESEIYPYGGIDMADQGYVVSNILGSSYSNLFHWDQLPLHTFNGIQPRFSPDGKYILCINGKSLKVYPSHEEEIIRLVKEQALFGELDTKQRNWIHIHSVDV
ncbi:MAG: PD40 domain-containing protein, partial [Bacteroidales bacterium]